MPLDLLDAPLRATWDFHGPKGATPLEVARTVAARLSEAGVFFVALGARPLAHPDAALLFPLLRAGGCRLSVSCSGSAAELAGLAVMTSADSIQVDAAPFLRAGAIDGSALAGVLTAIRDSGRAPGIQLVPTRTTLPLLPALFDFCRTHGVTEVKLPNTPVPVEMTPEWHAGLLDPTALAVFKSTLGADPASVARGLTLEIHDLFLWELLLPSGSSQGRGEYGGCQAGNSLAHIDAEGILYPCSSWPLALGSLLAATIEELWATPDRLTLRETVVSTPPGCQGCCDYDRCFGGCRGLSRTVAPTAAGRDLLCAAPRHR
jgi:GeoRSP system SPASM domain protein